jgi:hypothetical protein
LIKRTVKVDFSKKIGKLKPINCLNNGPLFGVDLSADFSEEYKSIAPPFIRVSSPEYPNASVRFLDVHCIFPDMELDERFEASYNFAPTDKYLAAVKECGAEIFLRLGETPEPYEVRRYTRPPRDVAKLARILERIIAHYNKGWANGFKYNVKYVEIMCDVDTEAGWCGSREEYYELYATVATYLKEKHPKLKVGAYSSGGFYALNRFNSGETAKSYVEFCEGFLNYISRVNKAPLDFLSWKSYSDSPEELKLHAGYARHYLDYYGFRRAQSIISEFNLEKTRGGAYLGRTYPSELATMMIVAAKSDVDMVFYSHLDPASLWNALYTVDGRSEKRLYAAYHVMSAMGSLVALSSAVDSGDDCRRETYSLAAANEERGALVLATANYSGVVEISLEGRDFASYSIKGIIGGGEKGMGYFTEERGLAIRNNKLALRVGKNEVYFFTFE